MSRLWDRLRNIWDYLTQYFITFTGVSSGSETHMALLDISPDSDNLVKYEGAVFHPQNEQSNGNVAFYEIQSQTDEIVINVEQNIDGLTNPVLIWNTAWGPTDFDLIDINTGKTVISEVSGYDSDVWIVDLTGTSGEYKLTNFEDTQAGWYAYVQVTELLGV